MNWKYALIFSVALLMNQVARADEGHHHEVTAEQLGSVSFEISCADAVKKPFNVGIAWLYSFEYEQARNQFEAVAAADPSCAIAYWGQAMSLYHQLWARPSKSEIERGRELLKKGIDLKPKTQRESDYIAALSLFFAADDPANYISRIESYSSAMDKLRMSHPEDHEASVFYALSLIALGEEVKDPEQTRQRKAVEILNQQLAVAPNHPGIMHYIIHATDNPQLASLGLDAARAYAKVAPASAHAVHMPAHIFARLGLWDEDIRSNLAAIAVADQMEGVHTAHHKLHSMDFLVSAYLQVGNEAAAWEQIGKLKDMPKTDAMIATYVDAYQEALVLFPATVDIETGHWKEALALTSAPDAPPYVQMAVDWAHAIAAGHLGDAAAATAAVDRITKEYDATKNSDKAYLAEYLVTRRDQAIAFKLFAEGKIDEAVSRMRTLADTEDKIGKGETDIPAPEMLGGMLLQAGRIEEALKEYELSLKTNPNRFNGLYGAARAAETLKMEDKSKSYYAQLLKNTSGTASARPEIAHAKSAVNAGSR